MSTISTSGTPGDMPPPSMSFKDMKVNEIVNNKDITTFMRDMSDGGTVPKAAEFSNFTEPQLGQASELLQGIAKEKEGILSLFQNIKIVDKAIPDWEPPVTFTNEKFLSFVQELVQSGVSVEDLKILAKETQSKQKITKESALEMLGQIKGWTPAHKELVLMGTPSSLPPAPPSSPVGERVETVVVRALPLPPNRPPPVRPHVVTALVSELPPVPTEPLPTPPTASKEITTYARGESPEQQDPENPNYQLIPPPRTEPSSSEDRSASSMGRVSEEEMRQPPLRPSQYGANGPPPTLPPRPGTKPSGAPPAPPPSLPVKPREWVASLEVAPAEGKKDSVWTTIKKAGVAFKEMIGLADKINRDHPDYKALKGMEETFHPVYITRALFGDTPVLKKEFVDQLRQDVLRLKGLEKRFPNEDERTQMIGLRATRLREAIEAEIKSQDDLKAKQERRALRENVKKAEQGTKSKDYYFQ